MVPKNNSCVQRQRKVNIQSKFASGKSPLVQCRQCKHYEAITSSSIIAPCECEGKLKYIHIDCLKNLFTAHIEVKKEKDNRDKVDDAWYEYEYSDYKDFKEWFDKYGNQLNDSAKDEFKELINRLEPTGFDLICNEVWK